ncbi:MAG: hypothetical protein IKU86_07100 [Thermoguttaceae bacterium]|nr:hypothetical protein [Thermoguttaceae bacterium]
MRLALRALFAATDANEEGAARRALLERRLRENERSAEFFRRLRTAVADVSLNAPEVFAEESFPDANVVAEYLDGQASPELARAYEDACWDSPEILAEAGRCYDVLNGGSGVECVVSKNCRRRLYYLAWEDAVLDASSAEVATSAKDSNENQMETTISVASVEKEEKPREKSAAFSERKRKEKSRKKATKAAKSENSVRSTLAAERSWGRRVRRFGVRVALAACLLGFVRVGWRALDNSERSETFSIQTTVEERPAQVDATAEAAIAESSPLRPTTISSATADELPTITLDDYARLTQDDALLVSDAPDETLADPPKLASLPFDDAKEGGADLSTPTPIRGGLGGDPLGRRPTIEIPARNNDVFSKNRVF